MFEYDFVKNALSEDIGRGDLFANALDSSLATKKVKARAIARENGVLSGEKYALALSKLTHIDINFHIKDSQEFYRGDVIATLNGGYADILITERTLLNILSHSSGIATHVAVYARILRNNKLNVALLDTRKTRPGLRIFEKYSIRNGGGINHRFGLDDCLMLKDTHLAHIEDLGAFIKAARTRIPWTCNIEVECEHAESAFYAMQSGANIIMCDNMTPCDVRAVVEHRNTNFAHIFIEASGNITKENILEYAASGVDAISSGALIHHAVWVDLSLVMDTNGQ